MSAGWNALCGDRALAAVVGAQSLSPQGPSTAPCHRAQVKDFQAASLGASARAEDRGWGAQLVPLAQVEGGREGKKRTFLTFHENERTFHEKMYFSHEAALQSRWDKHSSFHPIQIPHNSRPSREA